jgi:nucleotide-binding universal stress UspA family protein
MLPIETILYPTDFSPPAAAAFPLACALARDYGARLVVLHVHSPVVVGEVGIVVPESPEVIEALRKKLAAVKPADPAVPVEHCVDEGFPAEVILRVAREVSADLIVMGTHGRTGIRRVLMGSVAEEVLRRAPCPVMTVDPKAAAAVPVAATEVPVAVRR